MNRNIKKYLAEIGRKGGKKSKRFLDSKTARKMVQVREARRSFRRFHTQCFWSYDPYLKITADDLQWVADQLMKNGGRKAWEAGARLCP